MCPHIREDPAIVRHLLGNSWFILWHHQSVLGSSLVFTHNSRTPQYLQLSFYPQDPKGIQKVSARLRPLKKHLPITIKITKWIKHFLSKQAATYQSKLRWAATLFGFLHISEFTVPSQYGYDQAYHLSLTDVTLDNRHSPTAIQLHIKQSKTEGGRSIHYSLQKPQRYMPSSCHCTVPYCVRTTERAIVPLARWHNAHQTYFCFSTGKNYPQP